MSLYTLLQLLIRAWPHIVSLAQQIDTLANIAIKLIAL